MNDVICHPEMCCSCQHLIIKDKGYDWCSIRQEESICMLAEERTHSNCGNTQMLFLDKEHDMELAREGKEIMDAIQKDHEHELAREGMDELKDQGGFDDDCGGE